MAEKFMKLLSTTPLSYEQGKRRKFPNYIVDYFAFSHSEFSPLEDKRSRISKFFLVILYPIYKYIP